MTSDEILKILYTDSWFTSSKTITNKRTIQINGDIIEVSPSYYHHIENSNYTLLIRVSDHCTYLSTWINAYQEPEKSVQNLSVVLSDTPCTYNKTTKPVKVKGKDTYTYFVVEQYQYKLSNLSKSDFLKIIKRLKKLETDNIVYTDPLKNKPCKRAARNVLTPDDINGNPVHPSTNNVHLRQTVVANNKNNEIDINGNIIENKLYNKIMKAISEVIQNEISKLSQYN